MICATCGRDNPGHLVFCQECGQRLAPRAAVPADPPSVPSSPSPALAAPPPAPSSSGALAALSATVLGGDSVPVTRPISGRPLAPTFDIAPPKPPPPPPPAPPPPASAPSAAPPVTARVTCPRCAAPNDPGIRFCVSCGNGLGQMATVPIPPPGASSAAIAPARVVPVTPATPAAEVRVCARCRGACDGGAQFCRFCGAPLAASPAPAPGTSTLITPPQNGTDGAASPRPLPPPTPPPHRPPPPSKPGGASAPAHASPPSNRPPVAFPAPPAPSAAPETIAQEDLVPRARVVTIAKDGGEGASYAVGETLDLGRTEGEVVIPDDRYLSPRHARISRRAGRLYLRDLGSTNGLFLRLRTPPPAAFGGVLGSGPQNNNQTGPQNNNQATSSVSLAHPLRDQDLLLVGQQVLRFEVVNDAEEGLGPASQHGTLLFGSPATPRYARLCQRTVEGVIRDVFYIGKAETVLGRESGDVVFTEDPFLSRRHAVVRMEDGGVAADAPGGPLQKQRRFLVTDLGSSNGTFVQVRGELPLENGDQFRIGQQLFRVDFA